MKNFSRKTKIREVDDSLFGLLSAYKQSNAYFRILINEEKKRVIFQMTDNPKFFPERGEGFRLLSRTEIGVNKLSAKYLSPDHIVSCYGDTLNIKIPRHKGKVNNRLHDAVRLYQLETTIAHSEALLGVVKKIISLPSQKKYEIIEKYLSRITESELQE